MLLTDRALPSLARAAEEELQSARILVFANKQDLPGALSASDIALGMGLADISKTREWAIFPTSAKKNQGIREGMDWLAGKMAGKK